MALRTRLLGLSALASLTALSASGSLGCRGKQEAAPADGIVALSQTAAEPPLDPAMEPKPGGPKLGAIQYTSPIYEKADRRSSKIGYLRAGGLVVRGEKPVAFDDCQGGWYRVLPKGYACAGEDVSVDMEHPLLRALTRRPDLSKPMPYPYAFVRAVAPNYYRPPTAEEQLQYEMRLKEHLRSFNRLHVKWDTPKPGANDVPLDAEGIAVGEAPEEGPALDYNALFGGNGDDSIPWFFKDGRKIPNISSYRVPEYAVITNRIARKAGLAVIGTFVGDGDRRFAMTTDARLIPTTKLKPARGSMFHGVDLRDGKWQLPLAFVHKQKARQYEISDKGMRSADDLPWHSAVQLTGKATRVGDTRYIETKAGTWIKDDDVGQALKPQELPFFAKGKHKWIDVSIIGQSMVLYEGKTPVYATLVSTGRDGLGDPKKTFSTVRGTFKIRDKHVTTTMDAHEVDNQFELRDIPWVQYFEHGYAIHAALWHDDFGKPRSHGCVNMSPIDARRVFLWTDPPLPTDWHSVNASESTGDGTTVHIHP